MYAIVISIKNKPAKNIIFKKVYKYITNWQRFIQGHCPFGLLFIREQIALSKMSLIKLVFAPVFVSILENSMYLSVFN